MRRRREGSNGDRPSGVAAEDVAPLETALGHRFADRSLLMSALHHSSLGRQRGGEQFDRLEFLGDRVVGLAVAGLLLARYPEDEEGAIARRFAHLVNRDSLAALARTIDLGRYLRLSTGEAHAGGGDNPAVLSDAFEAVMGALYRDGGMEVAGRFLATHFEPLIAELTIPPSDAKTALQEWAQARGKALPQYRVVSSTGPAHRPAFIIEVSVPGHDPVTAKGQSKRMAEQEAAAILLLRLQGKS